MRSSPVVVSHSLHGPVEAGRGQPAAVRAERQRADGMAEVRGRCEHRLRFRRPRASGPRPCAAVARRRPSRLNATGIEWKCVVSGEGVKELTVLPVPDLHRPRRIPPRGVGRRGLNATVYAVPNLRMASHGLGEHLPGRSPSSPRPSPARPRRRRRGAWPSGWKATLTTESVCGKVLAPGPSCCSRS